MDDEFGHKETSPTDYDLARAKVLFHDLEHIGRGRAPGVELVSSADGETPVHGTATRLGLLRLAIRLGKAALAPQPVVVVHGNGAVSENTAAVDGLVHVFLADDPPAVVSRPARWAEWLLPLFGLAVAALKCDRLGHRCAVGGRDVA